MSANILPPLDKDNETVTLTYTIAMRPKIISVTVIITPVSIRLVLSPLNVCHATHHSTAVEVGFEKPRVPFRFLKLIKNLKKSKF